MQGVQVQLPRRRGDAGGDAAARMARREVHVVPTRSPDISDPAGRSGDQQRQLPAGICPRRWITPGCERCSASTGRWPAGARVAFDKLEGAIARVGVRDHGDAGGIRQRHGCSQRRGGTSNCFPMLLILPTIFSYLFHTLTGSIML
jgi:hypothetical protein